MESEWALNCVALGWADPPPIWRAFRPRPVLCGLVEPGTLIWNDYRVSGGTAIYNEVFLPTLAYPFYTVGPTRFAAGFSRFPFGRTLLASPLP